MCRSGPKNKLRSYRNFSASSKKKFKMSCIEIPFPFPLSFCHLSPLFIATRIITERSLDSILSVIMILHFCFLSMMFFIFRTTLAQLGSNSDSFLFPESDAPAAPLFLASGLWDDSSPQDLFTEDTSSSSGPFTDFFSSSSFCSDDDGSTGQPASKLKTRQHESCSPSSSPSLIVPDLSHLLDPIGVDSSADPGPRGFFSDKITNQGDLVSSQNPRHICAESASQREWNIPVCARDHVISTQVFYSVVPNAVLSRCCFSLDFDIGSIVLSWFTSWFISLPPKFSFHFHPHIRTKPCLSATNHRPREKTHASVT